MKIPGAGSNCLLSAQYFIMCAFFRTMSGGKWGGGRGGEIDKMRSNTSFASTDVHCR